MIITDTKRTIAVFLLFAMIGSALYGITLKSPFIMDDLPQIVENPDIKSFGNLAPVFKKGFLPRRHLGEKDQWYRPFQTLTYMVDYRFWRLNTAGYHITCIALHIVNACLIFVFLLMITGERFVSALTGLFFLIHPTNAEAVNYISGRGDLLLVCFILLAFISYMTAVDRRKVPAYFASLFFFSFALLSKETAVIFPGLIFLYHVFVRKKFEAVHIVNFLGFIVILAIYFVIRENLPILHIGEVKYDLAIPARVLNFVRITGAYFFILIWPVSLNISRWLPPFKTVLDPFFITGALALSGSLLFFVKSLKNKNGSNTFFLGWVFAAFLPTSGLLMPTTSIIAERYMYLPAIGLFFLLASAVNRMSHLEKIKPAVLSGLGAVVCFWCVATFMRNTEWTDPVKFYSSSIARNPHSIHRTDLAKEYSEAGDFRNALLMYEEALRHTQQVDGMLNPLNNMGNLYCKINKLDKAEECFKKTLSLSPGFSRAHIGLGNVYLMSGRIKKAIEEYGKAIEKGGRHPGTFVNMGICYERLKDPGPAEMYYQKAIQFDPSFIPSYNRLAFLYIRQNRIEEAKRICEKSINIDPQNLEAHMFL
ncbi:MAG: tetratricopeptide repeat protein, partial [Candidatus Omnitrophica bacterium]|nr:tetratricopeptide repeat protein [Candidatus Omnitrophota bacterium]